MPRLFNLSRVRLRENIYTQSVAPVGAVGTIIQVLDGDSESPMYRVQLDDDAEARRVRGFVEEELEVIGAEPVPEPVPSRSRTRWPAYTPAGGLARFAPRFTPRTSPPPQEQAASDEYWDVGALRAGRPPPTAPPFPRAWLDEPETQEESNASWNVAAQEGPVCPRPDRTVAWLDPGSRPVQEG